MFTPSPMRQVNIFAEMPDIQALTIALARTELFHLASPADDTSNGAEPWTELADTYSSQLQTVRELLQHVEGKRSRVLKPDEIDPVEETDDIDQLLEEARNQIDDVRQKQKACREEVDHLRRLREILRHLKPIEIPIEELRNPEYLHWSIGTLAEEDLEVLKLALYPSPGQVRRSERRGERKIHVTIPESHVLAAARTLVQFDKINLEPKASDSGNDNPWQSLNSRWRKRLARLERLTDALRLEPEKVPEPEVTDPEKDFQTIDGWLEEIENQVAAWEKRRKETEGEAEHIREVVDALSPLIDIEVPLQALREPAVLYWTAGLLPSDTIDHIRLRQKNIPGVLVTIPWNDDQELMICLTDRTHKDLLPRLSGAFYEDLSLPLEGDETPAATVKMLRDILQTVEEKIEEVEIERQELKKRWSSRLALTRSWIAINMDTIDVLSHFTPDDSTYLFAGWVPESRAEAVMLALESATHGQAAIKQPEPVQPSRDIPADLTLFKIPLIIIPFADTDDRLLVAAATNRDNGSVLDQAMRSVFLDPLTLPDNLKGIPINLLPEIEDRLARENQRMADLEKRQQEQNLKWGAKLSAVKKRIITNLKVARTIIRYPRHRNTFLVSGWVPETAMESITTTVEAVSEGRAEVELLEPVPGGRRQPPTRLRNPAFLKPFETIVRTYDSPDYHELDPTPLAGLSYILMFGLMFGDLGHGLILVLFGFMVNRKARGTAGALGAIIAISGISAAGFGLLYGSLFGREDILPTLWLNPLGDIQSILMAAIVAGSLILSTGFLMSIANALRNRQWGTFLFGGKGLTGFIFYWTLVGGLVAALGGLISLSLLAVIISVPALVLLFEEPLSRLVEGDRPLVEDNWTTRIAQSFFELFETTVSNASHTLSFLRMGAFAVAHAGFMHVIFSLAETGGDISGWLILIIGNILVIGFEGMVVGIQALRLEYYEFFSRFLRGGGVPYTLFRFSDAE